MLNRDLATLTDAEAQAHYTAFGRAEGRTANGLPDRASFGRLVSPAMASLEIGPFANPFIRGPRVRYGDMFDERELRGRAASVGLNPDDVPVIDFVLGKAGLAGVADDFDAVVSSHCIEHQPDLIDHLQQVQRLIARKGGRYFMLVPDKRYCFDRNLAESTISEVIQAHESGCRVHSLRNIINYVALATHNDPARHWNEAGKPACTVEAAAIRKAIGQWRQANDEYLDVHAWFFTPDSFAGILDLLRDLGYLGLVIERLYPTRHGQNEFWAILKFEPMQAPQGGHR